MQIIAFFVKRAKRRRKEEKFTKKNVQKNLLTDISQMFEE